MVAGVFLINNKCWGQSVMVWRKGQVFFSINLAIMELGFGLKVEKKKLSLGRL